jgi:hypothetical protein
MLGLAVIGACGGSSSPEQAQKPAAAATVAAAATPRDVAEVVVAVEIVHGEGWASERVEGTEPALEAAARGCLDEVVPADARPDAAQWVIGIAWDHSYAHGDAAIVAERSLEDSEPLPEQLDDCLLGKVPTLGDGSDRIDALIAIRTAGWVAAHGAGRPVDDPLRSMAFDISGTRTSGCDVSYLDDVDRDVVAAARRCTASLSPVRARDPEAAWRISVAMSDASDSGSGFGCFGGRPDEGFNGSTAPLPFGDAPAGFADCLRDALGSDEWPGVTFHVEAAAAGFRARYARYYEGGLGHGAP